MGISVANTNPNNTFDYWRNRTNEVATAMSVYAVTTDSNGNYVEAVGNSQITGTFTANVHFSNTLVVCGNATVNATINSSSLTLANSLSSLTLSIPPATSVSSGQYWLNANGAYAYIPFYYGSLTLSSAGTPATVDSFSMSTYRVAKYLVSVWDNSANNRYASEILLAHDGTIPYLVEYADVSTNTSGSIGTFSTAYSGSLAQLQFTPVSASVGVRFYRTAI